MKKLLSVVLGTVLVASALPFAACTDRPAASAEDGWENQTGTLSILSSNPEFNDVMADIIDVGAESTRPGAVLLSMDEELKRLVPQLVSLRGRFPKTPISVDTYKPEVARAAVENGADIINDVNADMVGGKYPMAELAAELKCPLIIMHNSRDEKIEGDFFEGFMRGMEFRLEKALSAGMSKDQIVLDPGFGFGKTVDQNYEIVRRLGELRVFGCALRPQSAPFRHFKTRRTS